MDTPPLRYLSAADVTAAMPAVEDRLALAETAMRALVADADLPPKIGVHPGPAGSFAHAMPAWMRRSAPDGSAADLLGVKWVAGFPRNTDLRLPTIHATAILNDAQTGVPRAVMDAGPITAHRTAAVSGLAIRRWGPAGPGASVALIGAGVQARSHLLVISHLLPDATVTVCGRDPDRLKALVGEIEAGAYGPLVRVRAEQDPATAVQGADLVVTMVSFGPDRQVVPRAAFASATTVVAIDYDMCVPASVAQAAAFLTDDREQFLANRTGSQFVGYPEPTATIGEALAAGSPRPDGQVLVSHLGVGLADVVFGDAILREAEARGIGTVLER